MKRKAVAAALAATLVFTGCGAAASETDSSAASQETQDTDTADETEDTQTGSEEQSAGTQYVYETEEHYEDEGEDSEPYTHRFVLDADGALGVLTDEYVYSENNSYITRYNGTVSFEDPGIVFTYTADNSNTSDAIYWFTLDGDTVTKAERIYADVAVTQLAGTYTCEDIDMGNLTLEIGRDGTATITTDSKDVYSGSITLFNDQYDFMGYCETTDSTLDWYITLDGDKFTYTPYENTDYSEYAGEMEIYGDLGEITVTIEENGNVTAPVEIDGTVYDMTGSISIDDDGTIYAIWMCTDDGNYTLSLDLYYIDSDQVWNYSGSLTAPLSAG